MTQPQQTATTPESEFDEQASSAFLTHCYRSALERLGTSFAEHRPFVVLIGEGRAAPGFVIRSFLSNFDEEVASVHIKEPCSDAVAFMADIIRAVGFEPKDMRLEDLESIFRMFLSFQKAHKLRTVICIEEAQANDWWVLDKIRRLVELEDDGQFGLMVLISGQPELKEMLYKRPLNIVAERAPQRITLVPFTLAETEEYIRRRVEAAGTATVDQVLDYHSIALIHELTRGVPDAISTLVSQCLDMADELGGAPVSTELVKKAYEMQRAAAAGEDIDVTATTVNLDGVPSRQGRLIVQLSGDEVRELALGQSHVLIGRSKLCDIRIGCATVSRQHALIVYSGDGATLVDLSSTNGTYVDGYQISTHDLIAGESIQVGDCIIEYVLEDQRQATFLDADSDEQIAALS